MRVQVASSIPCKHSVRVVDCHSVLGSVVVWMVRLENNLPHYILGELLQLSVVLGGLLDFNRSWAKFPDRSHLAVSSPLTVNYKN